MAVIRDVMPAFELFQPAKVDDALALLDRHGSDAWILAGGLDTFDWLKDRAKRTNVVIDLSQVNGAAGDQGGRRRAGDRRADDADRGGAAPGGAGAVRAADGSGGTGGVAADPQPGDAGRERVAGHAVLVLPERVDVLPGGREHLLRGHADGDQPGARDSAGGPVRGGEPVGHGAGADRAGRADGDPEPWAASGWCRRKSTSSGRTINIMRMTVLRPGELLTAIRIPATWAGAQFYFEKVRDRQVWDFPLVNVASAMKASGNTIQAAADRGGGGGGAAAAADGGGAGGGGAAAQRRDGGRWRASWRSRARSRCATTATRSR